MSELMNKLPTTMLNNELDYSNDRQIFDLINHLNDLNNRDESIHFKTESDNTSEPIEEDYDYDYDETNVNNYSEVSKQQSSTSQIPKPSRIPQQQQQQLFMSNSSKTSPSPSNQLITKIPRITPVKQSTNLNNIPLDLTSSSLSSISQPDHEPEIIKPKLTESKLRTPRCYQRNSSATPSSSNNEKQQRGQSQSAVPNSKQSSNRSLSITDSNYSLVDNNNNGGKKNVRYILKHKPRETQVASVFFSVLIFLNFHKLKFLKVKIFSQKVEIKNVHSKIGSLEKAATYTPGGGNVVVSFSSAFCVSFIISLLKMKS